MKRADFRKPAECASTLGPPLPAQSADLNPISGAGGERCSWRQKLCRGLTSLFIPSKRTRRPPKEMVPMKPAEFAAQLISRLESLKRKQDTISSLEERLQQIQEVCATNSDPSPPCVFGLVLGSLCFSFSSKEEEREDVDVAPSVPQLSPHPLTLLPGASDEDPQAILDDHLSRVLKTPGCQSPVVICRSPRSSSPEQKAFARPGFGFKSLVRTGPSSSCVSTSDQGGITLALGPTRTVVSRQSTKHIHHHYIHHHVSPKTKEQIEREAALRVHALCTSGGECPPYQRSRSLGREICGAVSTGADIGSVPVLVFFFPSSSTI